jgi:esterase
MILNTTTAGAGPPVLLLHGLFGAGKNLGAIARGLAPHAEVFSLDLRNHGVSPHALPMDYNTMAADIAETMDAMNLAAAGIIGHSMGGKTAMALALTQPARVAKLAIMDIAPISYDHRYADYVAAMQSIALSPTLTRHHADSELATTIEDAALRSFLLNSLILGPQPHWRLGLPELATAMPGLTGWQDPPGAEPYTGPTLFLRGANSDYMPPSAAAAITARFPNAEQKSIPNAGHWLHAEQPAAVIAELCEFLRT